MKTPKDIEQLEHLLRHRDFAELTDDEREWVLQHVRSEETYAAMRLVEKQLAQAFAEKLKLQPRPGASAAVREQLRARAAARPATGFARLVQLRVPVYQAAAAALVVLGWAFWQKNAEKPTVAAAETPAKDTVVVVRHDTVVRQEKVYVVRYRSVYQPLSSDGNSDTTRAESRSRAHAPQGVAMGEDTLLLRFFVNEREH